MHSPRYAGLYFLEGRHVSTGLWTSHPKFYFSWNIGSPIYVFFWRKHRGLFYFSILAKEPVRCNGRENITHALTSTTITQDHNRSIFFIFARHHICVAAYPPSHSRRRWPRCSHKTTKNVCWIWLILRHLSLPLSRSLAFSHSRVEKSVVFPCDIIQRYACVIINVFFSVYCYSGVFICNPDRRRYEKNKSWAINYKFASITIF